MNYIDLADKILVLAEQSVFYKNDEGVYRIEYTDMSEGYFQVLDENSGEEYKIEPNDVKLSDSFFKTIEVVLKDEL
jgi:hypothetical protein